MKDTFSGLVIALAIMLVAVSIALYIDHIITLPQCQEDVVLVGVGDFEHGRWTSYECGPAVDDYITGD